MSDVVAGIDIGSTSIKLLVSDLAGAQVLVASRPTPWMNLADGQAEMEAATLSGVIVELVVEAAERLQQLGHGPVRAVAVSGMAEAGVLLDDRDLPQAPIMAWFDPRGEREIQQAPENFRTEFEGRTGLPLSGLASIAKLMYLREVGHELQGKTFLNVPEYVVRVLGGERVAERSLAARTGMIDQDTGEVWPEALRALGTDDTIMGRLVTAGEPVGEITHPSLPEVFRGAVLSVAGHDHLVSAVAAGATSEGDLYDSMGTAEALVRVLDETLPFDARERLAHEGIDTVPHVVPSRWVLLAGTKSGLLMRRVLQMVGITDAAGRQDLDERVLALPAAGTLSHGALEVTGARNNDGVLKIVVNSDKLSPAEFFSAALLHGNDMCEELMRVMDREVTPPTATLLTGGWSKMASVVRARAQIFPPITVTTLEEGTAFGAALFAAFTLSDESDLVRFASAFIAGTTTTTGVLA